MDESDIFAMHQKFSISWFYSHPLFSGFLAYVAKDALEWRTNSDKRTRAIFVIEVNKNDEIYLKDKFETVCEIKQGGIHSHAYVGRNKQTLKFLNPKILSPKFLNPKIFKS